MTRRERIEIDRRARRLKRIGFVVFLTLVIGACGRATLSRSPDDVTEPTGEDATPASAEVASETETPTVTRAGIVKPIKVDLYGEGTHYLENEAGAFDMLLVSSAIDLTQFEDQMTELSGLLRPVQGDPNVQILVVTGLASVSEHMNQDVVAAVKRLADPSYGFTDTDIYTLVHSSASAGTAVVQIEHTGTTYHAKLVRRPDPLTGQWELYDLSEGAYLITSGSEEMMPPASEDDGITDATGLSTTTVGDGTLRAETSLRDGYALYEEPFAGYSIQFPLSWLYWAVGEAQTADGKPVSSRIMFSDKEVEYENVLISIDIAPQGITQTLVSYYTDHLSEQQVSVRGTTATKRTYSTSHVRVFIPRDAGSTFIISAIPRDGGLHSDVLETMLATLRLTFPG